MMATIAPDELAEVLVGTIQKALAPVLARLAQLEQRMASLEAKPHVKFCGAWTRGTTYEPGNAVVRDGALWICKATTLGEPSKDSVGWQLAVRKGTA